MIDPAYVEAAEAQLSEQALPAKAALDPEERIDVLLVLPRSEAQQLMRDVGVIQSACQQNLGLAAAVAHAVHEYAKEITY